MLKCCSRLLVFSLLLCSPEGAWAAQSKTPLFRSDIVTPQTPGRVVDVQADIRGKTELVLVVDDAGSKSCDWANWAEPRLVDAAGAETRLTTLKPKRAAVGWGRLRQNMNVGGKPMKIDGEPIAYGLGVHAPSEIHYELPKNHRFVTFRARGGLDDGGANQQSGNGASVRFLVLDTAPAKPRRVTTPVAATVDDREVACLPPEVFEVPEGYDITLWAKSPLFYNPTNMDIDRYGRIWVAEGRNYRRRRGSPDGDRIVVVSDTDGDGVADDSHVFVQSTSFVSPLGVAVVDNKVIVSQPPDLIVFTDVNRNAVFDEGVDTREVLLTGFDGKDHDHSLHSVTVGPNGQWYFNHGNKGSSVTDKAGWHLNAGSYYSRKDVAGKPSSDGQVYIGGVALRVNPDGTGMRPIGHNFRNSYEQAITSMGDVFQNDNDDPPACRTTWLMEYANMGFCSRNGLRNWRSDKMPGQSAAIAEWRQEDPGVVPAGDVYGGGSPTGIAVYENGVMEDALQGYVLSCEPARNAVFGYHPVAQGAGWTLPERDTFMTSNPTRQFAGTDFSRGKSLIGNRFLFRPSDVAIGPDGAIYIADWFDARVGGHGTRDQGQTGAIYRIAPKGATLTVPSLDLSTVAGQILALRSPAPNVRELGRSRLHAAGAASIPAVDALREDPNPYIAARAIWLLATLGPDGLSRVEALLQHSDSHVRLTAFRALRFEDHQMLNHAAELAGDKDPAVRREVALALRYVPYEQCKDILLDLARGYDGEDRYYLEAFGTACTDKEEKVYAALKAARTVGNTFDPVYANLVWRLQPVSALPELEGWAMDPSLNDAVRRAMLFSISLIDAPQAARTMVRIAQTGPDGTASLAREFVQKRAQGIWSLFKPVDLLNGKPAAPTVYADMLAPLALGPKQTLPPAKEILALPGDAARGQIALGRCYVCHKVGSVGVEFGPALEQWGQGRTRETILQAILDPSAELAHGFDGVELTVRGNKRIQGFIQAEGDPLVIRVFGGQDIVVAADDILSRKTLKTSLMVAGDKLGLPPQALRDVVEYLKTN